MRFPLPPTYKHIFINGEVQPYYGGAVCETAYYTEDHGKNWMTAVEAGLPLLPPVKLPPVTLPITPVTEPAPEPATASEVEEEPTIDLKPKPTTEPEPEVTPESFSVYCEYAESTYEWHLRRHEGKGEYQKVTTDLCFLYELIPVNHCDFSQKVSFDHLKKLLLSEEEIERTGWRRSGSRIRRRYSMFVEYEGSTYEVILEETED